jgi:hypothetical protein
MCGGSMRVKETHTVVKIPGNPKPAKRTTREWVCSECDHFEEAEQDGT